MNPKDILNIDQLFDDMVEEEVIIEKQSKLQLQEQERLQALYNLNKDNIDQVFESIAGINDDYEEEIIGKKFNKWTVIEYSHNDKGKNKLYTCKCDCGNLSSVRLSRLKNNKSKQCSQCKLKQDKEHLIQISTGKEPINKIIKNYVGEIINGKKILSIITQNRKNSFKYECSCGHISHSSIKTIKKKNNTKCKKCSNSKFNIYEDVYAALRIDRDHIISENNPYRNWSSIKFSHIDEDGDPIYICNCLCGNITEKRRRVFLYDKNASCSITCPNRQRQRLEPTIGENYLNWTVIDIPQQMKGLETTVIIQCRCGRIVTQLYRAIKFKKSRSLPICSKCPSREFQRKLNPQIGDIRGTRTVIEVNNLEIKGNRALKCKCKCGNELIIRIKDFYRKEYEFCLKCKRGKKWF